MPAIGLVGPGLSGVWPAIAAVFHAKATTATIRRQLIAVPARLATSARRLVLHLPKNWPWWDSWQGLFNATCGPPPAQSTT